MATPTAQQVRAVLERHIELWSAGDKDAWVANWRTLVTGDDVTLQDPVGTPPKRGFDLALVGEWDRTRDDWKLTAQELIACGSEGALVARNEGTVDGVPIELDTVEIYRFGADGSLDARIYWEFPGAAPERDEPPVMSADDMRSFFARGHELWNGHDVDPWIAHWAAVVTGGYTMEDPVGTLPKRGFDACRKGAWEFWNATVQLSARTIIVCGNYVALVVDNASTIDGTTMTTPSIETYAFGADGSLHERTYWEIAEAAKDWVAQYHQQGTEG
jgi:hypothetical protein